MKKSHIKLACHLCIICLIACVLSCGKEDDSSAEPSCSDGIMNQDETGVDCGGICSVCPTCDDGIQNQGELGIDCSGPCPDICDHIAPCDYPDNLVLYDHDLTSVSCDVASKTIIGTAETGTLTITFDIYPTSNSAINIGGGNSLVMDDELNNDVYTATSGKLYIAFTNDGLQITFCEMMFNSSMLGNFGGTGRVLCN